MGPNQKAWRERMGLDQKGFARALGFSQSLVESVEQCKRTPTVPYAERCEAVRIHGWEIGAVPGLLQTEGYTRSIVQARRPAYTAEDHAGVEGPVTVYDLNENRSVGYAECNGGGRIIETDDEVAGLLMMVNLLRASSLPVRESAALMRDIRSEMR